MTIDEIKWPPGPEELAWLLLNHTYRGIAGMFNVRHNKVQRLRDRYGLLKLNRRDRHLLLNRSDRNEWDLSNLFTDPIQFRDRYDRPYTRVRYGKKRVLKPTIRAAMQYILDRPLPPFVECDHTCGNPWCLNPDHIHLTYVKAYKARHNGKLSVIPDELLFRPSDYYQNHLGPGCIRDELPPIQPIDNFPEAEWEAFQINCLRADSILQEAIDRERRTAEGVATAHEYRRAA
jgi:hypothetical protein